MSKQRTDRLNSLLKEVISEVIRREVRNPHVNELFTITRVDISRDLHYAKVYFSVIGTAEQKAETLAALQTAAGFIAVQSSKQVVMRYFPTLTFKLDDSVDKHMRIEELLHKISTEKQTRKKFLKKTMPQHNLPLPEPYSGILLIDKPRNKTSFSLVGALRRLLKVKKIGHAGTLDPFATGVMVLLIGKNYTRLSDQLLCADKEYLAQVRLGIETDSYDCDGQIVHESSIIPSQAELQDVLTYFQGEIEQVPPMFSAKKQKGKKLYELARKGITVERAAVKISLETQLISYEYPFVEILVKCSKGTYIRSIAQEIGQRLGCFGHLSELRRTRSGSFLLANCIDGAMLDMPNCDIELLNRSLIKS